MKKLLLVSVIAIASAAAMIAPADARSHVFIGIGGYNDYYGNDYYDGYGDYGGRYVYSPYDAYDNGYRPRYFHRHHRCHVELVTHWRYHHRITEEIRVCR
ncbi:MULTISPECIES: hypothetical protein [Mesorhizobium]|jgi:hypothetical protein|uniref:Sulfur globule protein n=1 Tax=Rhizobium loti TaxID=381 RepID=A0A8E3B774_RHILI|nr:MULTISPECIES: hypothetical protein [Mesorhizobium]AZO44442.1 hypothetical protein EJ076_26770 [Mesorhizobium sp. M7D.F.Ca.US.005.01.1.1]PWJ94686.1 hypothetical protein C8D77_1011372 [Mesorhizobium loti]RUX91741.1 hypothetical protein EN993_25960 [Mesorhizobium sp. M7D.F.Ca.US.004.01.2.1]RVA22377.1 hypothetical protein EN935_30025 [Mesorhizobium sp. M7D.F.Ca.US.004.03.1.1]